jgi:hypothetical protein
MVLIHEPFPAQAEHPGSDQGSELSQDAQPGVFLNPLESAHKVEINGAQREEPDPLDVTLAGMRRSLTIMFGMRANGEPIEKFFARALAVAGWRDHDFLRQLIAEVDKDHRILGMNFPEG